MTEPVSTFKKSNDFSIVGGTYIEICREPDYKALMGSGFRAALALSKFIPGVNFKTCLGEAEIDDFSVTSSAKDIRYTITPISNTIVFSYAHPLKKPEMYPEILEDNMFKENIFRANKVLCYGMAECISPIEAEWLVYDPQSLIKFEDTGSSAKHLALILNKKEAAYFCEASLDIEIEGLGTKLMASSNAEVVVIKNGAAGAWVFERNTISHIPVFRTPKVWPIGSGDIFSAVFAWQWMHLRQPASGAALLASKFTATYCATQQLPLPARPQRYSPLKFKKDLRPIYLAGPFFNQAERWLIEELKDGLEDFGQTVFSPLHDVGTVGKVKGLVRADLVGINRCKAMLAVVSSLDPGTLFEIGYARAKRKKVVVLAEAVSEKDLFMLVGSGCQITEDLSTAIYSVSW